MTLFQCDDLPLSVSLEANFYARLGGLMLSLMDVPHPAITQRLRALAEDLDAIAAPTAEALASAPRLDDWSLVLQPDGIRIQGALDQASLPAKAIVTSAIWAVDPARRWARTLSRFYALGTPLGEERARRSH